MDRSKRKPAPEPVASTGAGKDEELFSTLTLEMEELAWTNGKLRHEINALREACQAFSAPFRVSVCAARTLNSEREGSSRIALPLR